jgi:tetratricopeptide (TPR) repeat protein
MDPSSVPISPEHELQTARRQLREGRRGEAEQSFRRLLQAQPENAEALTFLGNLAQARRDDAEAVNLLSRAAKANPADFDVLVQLGTAYRTVEQFDAAGYVLERAVRLAAGRGPYARLNLASLLELDRRPDLALMHYCLAMQEAQKLRRWSADDKSAAGLGPLVEHARQYVAKGRRAWFDEALQPLRPRAAGRWDRIDEALAAYLDGRAPVLADPRQRPGFMSVPKINTTCFLDNARFAWLDRGAVLISACFSEMDSCVAESAAAAQAAGAAAGAGAVTLEASRVSVLRGGVLQYEARKRAPQLQRVLAGLPLAQVPNHAPDVDIIALRGRGSVPRHYARSNSRCWLIFNPAGSGAFEVIVGGEKRLLNPGQTFVLDGSFGVEYANPGGGSVRALSVEAWHPDLSQPEQEALCALIAAAVDFDTRLQDLN